MLFYTQNWEASFYRIIIHSQDAKNKPVGWTLRQKFQLKFARRSGFGLRSLVYRKNFE